MLTRWFLAAVWLVACNLDGEVVKRWDRDPELSIIQGTEEHREVVLDVVDELNEVLEDSGYALQMVGDGEESADVLIFFAPEVALPGIAEEYGGLYVPPNAGFVTVGWRLDFELYRGVVMYASDLLYTPEFTRHIVLEELTQGLGLLNDSALVADSIFFETPSDPGFVTQLSEHDRRLVRLWYEDLHPGDDAETVTEVLLDRWGAVYSADELDLMLDWATTVGLTSEY